VAALVTWHGRFQYGWGYGDQEDFLPYLLHLLDDSLFTNDWFVSTQVGTLGVRTYFVLLLRAMCLALPPPVAICVVFLLSWLAIAEGIQRLTLMIGGGHAAAVVAVFGLLCVTPKWTLGGNDLVYAMLVPEMVSWALVLPALIVFARRRYLATGLLLGVAAWFQLLVGVQVAALLSITILTRRSSRSGLREAMIVGGTAAIVALPILGPVGLQQVATGLSHHDAALALAALTEVRAPHHYLPSSFSIGSWAKMAFILAAGLGGLWSLRRYTRPPEMLPAGELLAGVAAICMFSWVLTEVIPIGFVIKLQLFKLTVVAKLVAIILFATGLEILLRERLRWRTARIRRAALVLGGLAAILSGVTVLIGDTRPTEVAWRAPDLESWAAERTSADAVFVLPPSYSSFRSHARRAIVVNYAAFPFEPQDAVEWYERIKGLVGTDTLRGGRGLVSRLDSLYDARTAAEWTRFADEFGADYLVRRSASAVDIPFSVVYADDDWVAYRIPPYTARAE
jgi:hypothetical protein